MRNIHDRKPLTRNNFLENEYIIKIASDGFLIQGKVEFVDYYGKSHNVKYTLDKFGFVTIRFRNSTYYIRVYNKIMYIAYRKVDKCLVGIDGNTYSLDDRNSMRRDGFVTIGVRN